MRKKKDQLLYGFSPSNVAGNEQDNSLINNVKSRFLILNRQHEKMFDIAITDKNVIRVLNVQNKQLDPNDPKGEYFNLKYLIKMVKNVLMYH